MLQIIAFIGICLIWQKLKNAARGPRKPKMHVVIRGPQDTLLATTIPMPCGCSAMLIAEAPDPVYRVKDRCAAHRLLIETLNK